MKNLFKFVSVVVAATLGQLPTTLPANAELGNSIFISAAPCKVGDTRELSSVIAANDFVEWLAYGEDLSSQGGLASGCTEPKPGLKPIAIAVTINAVGTQSTGDGNLQAYPADESAGGVTVVYRQGTNISNSTIVGLCNDGACDGKFRIESRKADIPVSAIVTGYFYAQERRVAHVAISGGDYSSPQAAMADLDNWCPGLDFLNRCTIRVGSGLFVFAELNMTSYVSLIGEGAGVTILANATNGGVIVANDVSDAVIADMTIQNFDNDCCPTNDPVGVEINTTNASDGTNLLLRDLVIGSDGGASSTKGITINDAGGSGNVQPQLVNVRVPTQTGVGIIGIELEAGVNPLIERVWVENAGIGLKINGAETLPKPITFSQFYGDTSDVDASGGAAATFISSHMGTSGVNGTNALTCVSVTNPTTVLNTTGCGVPP